MCHQTIVPYINQTIVYPSVLLSLLSVYVVTGANVLIKINIIIDFLILLTWLNANMVAKINILAKTIKTKTYENK